MSGLALKISAERVFELPDVYSDARQVNIFEDLCLKSLIKNSSLLSLKPELAKKSFAEEIALDELEYFLFQTLHFEVLGAQLLSSMIAKAPDSVLSELIVQASEEARHIEVYKEILASSSKIPPGNAVQRARECCLLHDKPFLEQVAKGFVVLESLAVGMFGARASLLKGTVLGNLELQLLLEESMHQSIAVEILVNAIHQKEISLGEVKSLIREGCKALSTDMFPDSILIKHGIGADDFEKDSYFSGGFLKLQTMKSLANIKTNLRRIQKRAV